MEYRKGFYTGIAVGVVFMVVVWAMSAAWYPSSLGSSPASPGKVVQELRAVLETVRAMPAEELLRQNVRSAFNRYVRLEFLKEEVPEDQFKWLGTTKEELESLYREAGDVLVERLTWHLKQGKFLREDIHCEIEISGGGSYHDYLDIQTSYSTAREIERIGRDADVGYDNVLCRKAVVQYAAKEGPQLRKRWISEEKFGWGDAAGCLMFYLTEDGIRPSVLGLKPAETYRLLEMNGGAGS